MEKSTVVEVNGNKYGFTCRSYKEDEKTVHECDFTLDDKILSVGKCIFYEVPTWQSYEFSCVVYDAVKLCYDTMYYTFLRERGAKKFNSKLLKEFNAIPLIKDLTKLHSRLEDSIWDQEIDPPFQVGLPV